MKWKHPSIVAIRGQPCTGKTTLAKGLAMAVRFCFLIELDEILDAISPSPPPSTEAEKQQITSQAHDILCGLVETQLSLGVSVFIDYLPPSSAEPLLDRLAAIAASHESVSKFVVVDLKIAKAEFDRVECGGVSTLTVNADKPFHCNRVGNAIWYLILTEGDNHVSYADFVYPDDD